jgi:hypothetical protein
MAMTLAEAAVLSQNELARGVMETFVQASPIFDRLPLMPIQGNAYAYNVEATLPGVAFRAVNEAYTESTGTFNQRTETLAILGGDADLDKFLVATRGNINDLRAVTTAGDVSVDPKSFDGLKKRLTGSQVIDAATNGIGPVAGGNDFFDALDALFAAVAGGPDVAYANSSVIGKIKSAGRRLGGIDMVQNDITGRRDVYWNGVPILDIGTTSDGTTNIIAQTETQGSASNASSIYAVKFGQDETDQAVTGLANNMPEAYDLGELQSKPAYRTRIDFYCGLAVFGGKAAARLRGVLNA